MWMESGQSFLENEGGEQGKETMKRAIAAFYPYKKSCLSSKHHSKPVGANRLFDKLLKP
jgi:hypothetical protein